MTNRAAPSFDWATSGLSIWGVRNAKGWPSQDRSDERRFITLGGVPIAAQVSTLMRRTKGHLKMHMTALLDCWTLLYALVGSGRGGVGWEEALSNEVTAQSTVVMRRALLYRRIPGRPVGCLGWMTKLRARMLVGNCPSLIDAIRIP